MCLRMWSLKTYQCVSEFRTVNSLYPIYKIDEERVVCGGEQLFTIINIEKGVIEDKVEVKEVKTIYGFMMINHFLICTCKRGKFVVYNTLTKNIILKKFPIMIGKLLF